MADSFLLGSGSSLGSAGGLWADINWNRALNLEKVVRSTGGVAEKNKMLTEMAGPFPARCASPLMATSVLKSDSNWNSALNMETAFKPRRGELGENNSSLRNCFKEAGWTSHRYPGEKSGEEDLSYIWKKPLTAASFFHTPTTPLGGQGSSLNILKPKLSDISDNKLGRVMQKKPSLYAKVKENSPLCQFCKKNGESKEYYTTHSVKVDGKVTCPILWRYTCPKCGATGESAHTLHYCPLNTGWRKPTRELHNAGGRIVYVPPKQ